MSKTKSPVPGVRWSGAGMVVREFGGSEFTKFFVDQWQKPLVGGRITVLDLG